MTRLLSCWNAPFETVKFRVLLQMLAVLLWCSGSVWAASTLDAASNSAHNWLKSQMTTTGMVDSYKDKKDVCHTYDQAVAAMAFLVKNDVANARKVLTALSSVQNGDGSFYSAYACTTLAPLSTARYVGSNAWVVLAVAHYEKRTGDTVTYHIMGLRTVDWMRLWQQADGGINGGLNSSGVPLTWASTEHNENSYNSLGHFAYPGDAADVRGFLDNVVWNAGQQRWNQGRNDPMDPLDVNPLGVSALGISGAHEYQLSLNYPMTHHRSVQTWGKGRRSVAVDGFDFDSDHDDIWLEGTAQMVKAFIYANRLADASYFLGEILKVQQNSGGVPYSVNGSFNGDFTMSKSESVAATGWLILALEDINPLKP